jgi:phytanoyl-CoA hydroxylase
MITTDVLYGLEEKYRLPVLIQEKNEPDFNYPHGDVAKQVDELGYVIARDVIEPDLCDALIEAFKTEVKPFEGPLYRQISMMHVPHKKRHGFVTNAFLSLQDLTSFPTFRLNAIEVIAHPIVQAWVKTILREKPQLVESTFWESTLMGTPLHCDGDYINSIVKQKLIGGWFALEDIEPDAGRFLIVPKSHLLAPWGNAFDTYLAYRNFDKAATGSLREDLKQRIAQGALLHEALLESGLIVIAPRLNKGDGIFWDSRLVHGSLPPGKEAKSRYSIAGHYIPDDDALVMHGRHIKYEVQEHHGMRLRANAYPGDINDKG